MAPKKNHPRQSTSKASLIIPVAVLSLLLPLTAVRASTLAITYSLSGTGTVVGSTPTTLTLDTAAIGSILSNDYGLNVDWNPVSFSELCTLDFTTNLLQGNFTLTFQDGDTLTGTDLEDQSIVDRSPDGTGPYTQLLTFTGGTGQFAGATGSAAGNGFIGTSSFTESGSGTLNLAPEPESAVLLLAGLAFLGCGPIRRKVFRQMAILSFAILLMTVFGFSAQADTLAYVETSNPATGAAGFGTLDLQNGAYQSINSSLTISGAGLVNTGSGLLTLGPDGNLYSINPSSGVQTSVGATGLSDCSAPPSSPCGLMSANAFGSLNGTLYATDYAGNLYRLNAATGHATLIGATGLPAITFVPFSTNPDGTLNVFDESLFDNAGKLYANADILKLNPNTGMISSVVVPDSLYSIDPVTGKATLVAATTTPLNSFLNVDGAEYAFDGGMPPTQILRLNLTDGSTSSVASADPEAGLILGATLDTPEPAAFCLLGLGLIVISGFNRLRRV
jgi:hypothetical protein